MSGTRIQLDLFIPKQKSDTDNAIISALFAQQLFPAIKKIKVYATKINEGKANEEMTIRTVWHKCYHDEGKSCEPEQEI